jgi:UPF0716 protein FxsA
MTVALLVASAFLGVFFIRHQALGVLFDPERLMRENNPEQILLDAPLLALGGLLLILPGFISDAVGLLLLLPWMRRRVAHRWAGRVVPVGRQQGMRDGVIEGEYTVVHRADDDRHLPPQ